LSAVVIGLLWRRAYLDTGANPSAEKTGKGDSELVSSYHVIKDAVRARLLTGAGLVDASVVKVAAANDLPFNFKQFPRLR
jgi:hypothetical protein